MIHGSPQSYSKKCPIRKSTKLLILQSTEESVLLLFINESMSYTEMVLAEKEQAYHGYTMT